MSLIFEDSFAGTNGTDLSAHVPTSVASDTPNGSWSWTAKAATTSLLLNGSHGIIQSANATSFYYTNVTGETTRFHVDLSLTPGAGNGDSAGVLVNWDSGADHGYFFGIRKSTKVVCAGRAAAGGITAPDIGIPATFTPAVKLFYRFVVVVGTLPHVLIYQATDATFSTLTLIGEGDIGAKYTTGGVVAIENTNNQTTGTVVNSVQVYTDATPATAPTPGTITATVTGSAVNASVAAASGTTGPYTNQWHVGITSGFAPSGATAKSGETGLSLSSPYAPPDSGIRFLKVVQTDSLSVSATTVQVPFAAPTPSLPSIASSAFAGTIKIVAIGDSIMQLVPTGGSQTPVDTFIALLQAAAPSATVSGLNRGVSGTTCTVDWAGNSYRPAAATAAASFGATDMLLMLGTNDCKSAFAASPSLYIAALSTQLTYYFANISSLLRIWLCNPPYTIPGSSSGAWTDWSSDLARQYGVSIAGIVNGTTIRQGATDSFRWTAANPGWTPDGIHPNDATGRLAIAKLWAAPLASYLATTYPVAPILRRRLGNRSGSRGM